jgi:hypothetical protein
MLVLFVTFESRDAVDDSGIGPLAAALAALPGADRTLIHRPAVSHDPYVDDGAPPALVLQIYFPTIEALESACAADGPIAALPAMLPSLAGASISHQAMLVRRFPVPDPVFATPPGALPGTYLVTYEGTAENINAWLSYYIAHHPGIMARFPGIREIEITTGIDWCDALPWRRVSAMQRNKVVFDSPEAITLALNSPVRHEMRADFHHFPPFDGRNTHYSMRTLKV